MSVQEYIDQPCYHCGENCGRHPVVYDDKPFCCQGCQLVYEILQSKDACTYYDLEKNPGIRLREVSRGDKYEFLDHPEAREKILDFSEGGIAKVKFFIPIIHCSSCIWLLENLHKLHEGIVHASVNFVRKEAYFTFQEDAISLRKLAELLHSVGYPPQITLSEEEKKEDDARHRRILQYRLGVAGFAFGNIMLMALPDYLAGKEGIEASFLTFFTWANFVLATPVFFYSGAEYFSSAWKGIRSRLINIDVPIALGLITLYSRSIYEVVGGTGTGYFDSLAGLVFFLLIGKWYQNKSYQALSFERDYKSYFPVAVTRIGSSGNETVMLERIKPGDRLLIRNNELIPADSLLVTGDGHIDYSFVSGEAEPVEKRYGDSLFAGGRQIGSSIEIVVEKDVEQSYLTQLWNQENMKDIGQSKIQSAIDVVSRYFTIVILGIGFTTLGYWLWKDPAEAVNAFTSVLIIACPCALALTIPFAFGNAMRIFGRNGLYLRAASIVETMAKVKTIVFDKTGTITAGSGHAVTFTGEVPDKATMDMLRSVFKHSTHPLSVAISRHLGPAGEIEPDEYEETAGKGIRAVFGDTVFMAGSAEFTGASGFESNLASTVHLSINGKDSGWYNIRNRYRDGLSDLVTDLSSRNRLHLLSGDHDHEFNTLLPLFGDRSRLHFNQSPVDKFDYVRALKDSNETVCMIGDGLNDAGALKESDVGISVADDIYHFSPACDGILESDRFADLGNFLRVSRRSMVIVKISFLISFLYNVVGLSFAVRSVLTPLISSILMPASSVMVVAFVSLGTLVAARRAGLKTGVR